MKLTYGSGAVICDNENEIEKTIRKCASSPFDEIWLDFGGEYPRLTILVNGELACVQFSESGEKSYHSVGDENSEEITKFYAGGLLSELPNSMVISLSSAIDCAKYFFLSRGRSAAIKWNEI